jgi:methyl halide transferase
MPIEPPREAHQWEQRYLEQNTPWESQNVDSYLVESVTSYFRKPETEKADLAALRALDIGCGTGTHCIWLADKGFDVLGVDLSDNAIEQAKTKALDVSACRFEVGDFFGMELATSTFDLVYDRGCFHCFSDHAMRLAFAQKVAACLKPGGLWVNLSGSTDGPERNEGPPRRSARDLVECIEPDFEILDLKTSSFDQAKLSHARAWRLIARRREAL